MKSPYLTENQHDMLHEVVNIAMGQAGADLAVLLNGFVDLTVPKILILQADKISETITAGSVFEEKTPVIAFSQSFTNLNGMNGDAVIIFDETAQSVVGKVLGIELDGNVTSLDFMLDLVNMLVGACLNGLSRQLFDADMTFGKPEVLVTKRQLREMAFETFNRRNVNWEYSLTARITFVVRDSGFKSDLLLFLSERAADIVISALSQLLEED